MLEIEDRFDIQLRRPAPGSLPTVADIVAQVVSERRVQATAGTAKVA